MAYILYGKYAYNDPTCIYFNSGHFVYFSATSNIEHWYKVHNIC